MQISVYDQFIHNYRDARLWISLLREDSRPMSDAKKDRHDEIKRALRRFYKKVCEKANSGETRFGDWDWYTHKYPLPEAIKTKEEAVEYFEEYEYMECEPSQYDCTGQLFTSRYCVFQKPDGRWWCYHVVCMDV